jgi:CheY-like chemotaxis protein/anti-sigma regulatory factor (Ser/Thr protein kinase)
MHLDHSIPRARGQAGPLIEVITNLAVNARDAMPGGGVITIETKALPADDHSDGSLGQVVLIVRDTGIGMDAETLARACEPFFSTKVEGAGTGLGLALVRDIVQQCGGTLAIHSTLGVGTEVTVALPAVRPDDVVVTDPVRPELESAGGFETILLVEDDASVREIVAEFLRGAAYDVLEACDSEQALAIVSVGPKAVDLLVTDIVLPGQSGPELAGALRRFAPQMRTLFISGYPSESNSDTRLPAFLAKPFSRAALLQAVRVALTAPRHREARETDSEGRLGTRELNVAKTSPRDRSH